MAADLPLSTPLPPIRPGSWAAWCIALRPRSSGEMRPAGNGGPGTSASIHTDSAAPLGPVRWATASGCRNETDPPSATTSMRMRASDATVSGASVSGAISRSGCIVV